jgi:mRNA-degrading endonuclease RelE of RelBE toxin-antitoxin system
LLLLDINQKEDIYRIDCNITHDKIKGLNRNNRSEIINLKDYLRKSSYPSQCRRVKKLRHPRFILYMAYIGNKAMRLTFTINDNSRTIVISDITTRTMAFKKP